MTTTMIPTGEATAILPAGDHHSPVKVFGTEAIRNTFDDLCLQQAINSRCAPGVTELVLNPDAHCGYGAPIGCVLASPTHVYPGPVGFDIKCSMSLLQTDLPADAVQDKSTRRALIDAVCRRIPTGMGKGSRDVPKARRIDEKIGSAAMTEGASPDVLSRLGIPIDWPDRCEDAYHRGHDGTIDALKSRLYELRQQRGFKKFRDKVQQLGSYGGGNHFGECEVVQIADDEDAKATAEVFGLIDGHVAFLSHCGSRGIGHRLASHQFQVLEQKFDQWGIPYPGSDKQLVYAPLGSVEADRYLDDMALGANFATVNHLLINALVLEAFQEIIPGTRGHLVYFISHNIARQETVNQQACWVHRKGATRAFPGGHPALARTPFAQTGHPILLPGNPQAGSSVMVAATGAKDSCYSVNHGAGRVLGRRRAIRELNQESIDQSFNDADILTNCRRYPRDEAPAVYKDFNEVLRSVSKAGLATEVARLRAKFVIKDAADADD
ncbi:RtcB family protein [Crateriforma conspicua]|uniref:tRNA-splicing ligase RtcB n=1 Tax=Crateriforma conspicua TaxID=2527996 RepID=A0A5C5Y6X7_9PLAN|nr:RtcB family protein [Crateriforma conspicua]TWT70678.1 RNA-splicing ligase RtcB [Crateriforma conspicua]